MSLRHYLSCISFMCLALGGCTTTPKPADMPVPGAQQSAAAPPDNSVNNGPAPSSGQADAADIVYSDADNPDIDNPDKSNTDTDYQILIEAEEFDALKTWKQADKTPAFIAFTRSCDLWTARAGLKNIHQQNMHQRHKQFGRLSDWQDACDAAAGVNKNDKNAITNFFTSEFLPVRMIHGSKEGLLTGYYQPEIEVKRNPEIGFTEPVLTTPWFDTTLTKPRREINVSSGHAIAYGRPADVFFMQVQGSGILRYDDGQRVRAAYADNNGHKYTSIGRVLINRGELSPDKASKQDIEDWMERAGYEKTRQLMNENDRYIFFRKEEFIDGIGPKGAMQVPLSDMGSIAVDPSYYPYGLPIWVETKLPQKAGDYRGEQTGLLVISQDTGKAIRGAYRGDIYFGSGDMAGKLAGVMKHPASWTVLLPISLAHLILPTS